MTPIEQRGVWKAGDWIVPADAKLADDERRIEWSHIESEMVGSVNGLIDWYESLEKATPAEVLDFVANVGVPEVASLEQIDRQRGAVSVAAVQRHARGFAATRRIGQNLSTRQSTDWKDWIDASQWFAEYLPDRESVHGDWRAERVAFTQLLSTALVDGGVCAIATWQEHKRLAIEPLSRSLLGVFTLLLAYEVGDDGAYVCDSCGAKVYRARAPRKGHRVYCDRPECKREQQRRNQAAWRANKVANGGE